MSAPLEKTEFSSNVVSGLVDEEDDAVEEVILATAGYDHTIKFWQAHTGQCVRTLQHTDSQVNALEISPDGQLLAACGYQHIKMFDVNSANANPVVNYEGVSKNVMDVGFQENGKWMYTCGEDGTVKIWDLRMKNLQCQRMYQANNTPVNCVALHPNQQELVIGDQNGFLHIWNLRSDQNEQFNPEQGASIQRVAIDAKGRHLACVNNKGNCYIYNLVNNLDNQKTTGLTPRNKIVAHKRYALRCKFSPDSSLLVTSSADQTCKLWRTQDFSLITDLTVDNQRWVWDVAFSADSQYLFTASSDNMARLWSLPTNEVRREYSGHQKAVTCLAFRDGSAG